MSDDGRPKERKSWRDIDRGRDRSAHRASETSGLGGSIRRERSTRTYRAALDRAFDRGGLGKALGESVGEGAESRIRMLATIREASDPEAISRAVDAFVARFGALPDDIEIWAQAVWHENVERVEAALLKLEGLLESQMPKRTRALIGRLRYLEELAEEPEMRARAASLRKRLG